LSNVKLEALKIPLLAIVDGDKIVTLSILYEIPLPMMNVPESKVKLASLIVKLELSSKERVADELI